MVLLPLKSYKDYKTEPLQGSQIVGLIRFYCHISKMSKIWNLHCFSNYSRLVDVVRSVLRDQFIQQWECEMNLSLQISNAKLFY